MIEGSTDFGRELLKAYPEAIEGALVLVWTDAWIEVRVEVLGQDAAGAESTGQARGRAHEAGTYAIECPSRRLRGEETVTVWQRPLAEGAQP